ncbi:DNA gyrase subunit A [Ponticaulis sp.]|uniref:DNA gyrase subunit A n=1 Tax=Ponticaulis sp. TaxID=2020902 RepID=UPI000B6B5152|nr:DNA gyrase subunit A [Ponticaulis sp.]OUX96285.1 MAG: DNA gyrase subunit A [Hyphomonadaceae bacterium TMED5]
MSSDNETPDELPEDGVDPITIENELKRSYLDYAMSVIVSRALPDVRDGLKPVHRRILYAMQVGGYRSDRPYFKSARVVGDVIGKYHPHGDSAVYDALVRMTQPFSMGLPLVDGQGNFGSIDNDPPAAMRYTECRMDKAANFLLTDYDKDTVDFQENYDGKEQEPVVLPAQYPNLLVNGAGGIAVGMATNIPPHNLGEVIDATLAMIDNPAIDDNELLEIVPGPDFPTGGLIIGRTGARNGLLTGRGSVVMRSRSNFETMRNGREAIVITEIPYQVNKANLVEKISDLVREKRVEGIADLRDESDRSGIRVVIEIKKDASPEVVLNQLYRYSQIQTSFGVNMLALNGGTPEQMALRDILKAFIRFREDVVARRTKFELNKARDRAHVLVGLALAVANIDEVIRIIRNAPDPGSAREALLQRDWPAADMMPLISLIADRRTVVSDQETVRLSDEQARSILELRLHRLTALGKDEIGDEAKGLAAKIADYLEILRHRSRVLDIIRGELNTVKDQFAVPRRSEIVESDLDMDDEDLIEREDMVVTVTHGGYVKRTPLTTYRTQHRGGKGRSGMAMKDEDFVTRLFAASTHAEVLFFSSTGMVYKQKVWRLPLGSPQSRGKALVNILPLDKDESITSVMLLPEDQDERERLDVMFATRKGGVRRNKLMDFVQVNRNGKIAMKPDEDDGIVNVQICSERDDVLLTTANAQCIRFRVDDVRVFTGRTSSGVRGIRLAEDDEVISLAVLRHVDVTPAEARAYLKHATALRRAVDETGEEAEVETAETDDESGDIAALSEERIVELGAAEEFLLTITSKGMGKRASAYDYRVTGRGGKGLIAHRVTDDAKIVGSFPVDEADDVMMVTNGGQLIRCPVNQIRIAARSTQGVRVLRTSGEEKVVSVERLAEQEDKSEGEEPEATE